MGGVAARRVGLLGGTFDPPHVGHLWLAETARDQLRLDEVWFLPVGQPPHKEGESITAVSHRLAMTERAIAGAPYFSLSTLDVDRPPPHTTASLLRLVRQEQPAAHFWLLIGADSLQDFASWVAPQEVIAHCRLAVLDRPGAVVEWEALETAVPGIRAAVDWLAGPTVALSASEIRRWAANGRSLRYLTLPDVLQYIQEMGLYEHSS